MSNQNSSKPNLDSWIWENKYKYDLLDYSGCYYEGDRPSIDIKVLVQLIKDVIANVNDFSNGR